VALSIFDLCRDEFLDRSKEFLPLLVHPPPDLLEPSMLLPVVSHKTCPRVYCHVSVLSNSRTFLFFFCDRHSASRSRILHCVVYPAEHRSWLAKRRLTHQHLHLHHRTNQIARSVNVEATELIHVSLSYSSFLCFDFFVCSWFLRSSFSLGQCTCKNSNIQRVMVRIAIRV
jgi:hypothetical protein